MSAPMPPSLWQQFLDRLGQHVQSIVNPLGISGTPEGQGLGPALEQAGLGAINATLGTVGLGLEGGRYLGGAAAGVIPAVVDETPLRNLLSPDARAQLDQIVGQAHDNLHADFAANGPNVLADFLSAAQNAHDTAAGAQHVNSTPLSWATGAAALGLDPSNYVGGLLSATRAIPVIGRALAVPDFALNVAPEIATDAAKAAIGKALAGLAPSVADEAAQAAPEALQAAEKAIATPGASATPSVAQGALQALRGASASEAPQAAMNPAEAFLRQLYGDAYDHQAARTLNVDFTGNPDTFAIRPELQGQYKGFLAGLTPEAAPPAANGSLNLGVEAANLRNAPASNLAQLAAAAYGQRAPFMLQQLTRATPSVVAAALRGEAPLTVAGQDITQPVLDYLAGHGGDRAAALKTALQGGAVRPALENAYEAVRQQWAAATDPALKKALADQLVGMAKQINSLPITQAFGQAAGSVAPAAESALAPLARKAAPAVTSSASPALHLVADNADQVPIGRNPLFTTLQTAHNVGSATTPETKISLWKDLLGPGLGDRMAQYLRTAGGDVLPIPSTTPAAIARFLDQNAPAAAPAAESALAPLAREAAPEIGPNSAALLAQTPALAGDPFYDPATAAAQGKPWTQYMEKWASDHLQLLRARPDFGLIPQNLPNVGKTAVASSALGALGGFALPADSTSDRFGHAGEGAALGAGLGLGLDNTTTGDLIKAGAARGVAQQRLAFQQGIRPGLRDLPGIWKSNITVTAKNLFQDLLFNWTTAREAGYKGFQPYYQNVVDQVVKGTEEGPNGIVPQATADALAATGQADRHLNVGTDFMRNDARYNALYHPVATAMTGAGMSLLNPATAAVPAAGVALAALRGGTRAFQNELFLTIIDAIQSTFRFGAFDQEYRQALANTAPDFLARLSAAGIDTAPLAAKDGLFAPADVAALAGEGAGNAWGQIVDGAVKQSEGRVRQTFLDFSSADQRARIAQQQLGIAPKDWNALSKAEQAANLARVGMPPTWVNKVEQSGVGTLVPFIGWALRAYPRTVQMALNHPAAALALFNLYAADHEDAYREGKPLYAVGSLPISDKTPIVGKLVDLLTGGQGGTAYVNPLQVFSPAQPNALNAGQQFAADTNVYQKASDALGLLGFQFNPLIQNAAYAAGLDGRPALPFSRTSEIEQALGPGGYQKPGSLATIPSLLNGPLRAARSLATGQQVPPPDDPALRMAEEQAIAQTGLPLGDPRNLPLAHAYNDKTTPQAASAKMHSDVQLLAKGIIGLISPATLSPQTAQQQATAKAQAALSPFTPMQIAEARQRDPNLALAMQRANQYALAQALHGPDKTLANQSLVYENPGVSGDERLYQFARQYAHLQAVAPSLYQALLSGYARQIGAAPDGGGSAVPATGKAQP